MQTSYEILELFPTPVYVIMIPEELASIIPFFDKQDMTNHSEYSDYGFRSKDSYILNKPECKDLSNFILTNVKEYATHLGYDYDTYKFSQSWISIKAPNQQHVIHSHPNNLISGVFYYGPSVEKTPAIKFHKPILGVNSSCISPKTVRNKKDLKYAQEEFSIVFTAGLLILFPSYLLHSVPLNKTNQSRHSLAFNIVPEIGFGDEITLTELLFKKESNESKLRTKKR